MDERALDERAMGETLEPQPYVPPASVLGVVLAAGAGSRYVGPTHKLAAKLAGKPVVWWATRHALDAGFDEVVVIEGSEPLSDLIPAEASLIRNDDWADGQARTLQVAVHYAAMLGTIDSVVIGLGDQPFVPPEAWRRVSATEDGPIAVAEFDGERTPPVRLPQEVWNLLPVDGDEGARQLLRSRPEYVTGVPCPGSAVDLDTAAGFDQIRRHHLAKELGTWT